MKETFHKLAIVCTNLVLLNCSVPQKKEPTDSILQSEKSMTRMDSSILQNSSENTVIIVQGIFNANGDSLLKIKPLLRKAWHLKTPLPNQQKGVYEVVVNYKNGSSQAVPFDAMVADDSPGGKTVHGFFEVDIPVNGPIHLIQIIKTSTGFVYKTFSEKDIPPD